MRDNTRIRTLNHTAVSLWASALVILALVIVQAGRMDTGHIALADVASVADFLVANVDAGGGEDVVVMLDTRDERLFLYNIQNRQPVLLESLELTELFMQGRQTSGGGR